MAFGGAGPLHACDVARSLGIREIWCPKAPASLCAQGLIVSDLKEDFVPPAARLDGDGLEAGALRYRDAGRARRAGSSAKRCTDGDAQSSVLDMRYVGQNFELPVVLGQAEGQGAGSACRSSC